MRCSGCFTKWKAYPHQISASSSHRICRVNANIFELILCARVSTFGLSDFSTILTSRCHRCTYYTVNIIFMLQKARWSSVTDNPHHSSLSKLPFRCQLRQRWVADDGVHQREIKAHAFPNVPNPCHSITISQICCSDFFSPNKSNNGFPLGSLLFANMQIRFIIRVNEHTTLVNDPNYLSCLIVSNYANFCKENERKKEREKCSDAHDDTALSPADFKM